MLQPCDSTAPQLRTMRLSRAHQTHGEGAGLDQGRRLRRAKPIRDYHASRQPRSRPASRARVALIGVAAIGCETPIAPGITELGSELGVELEAPPRQFIERATAAPVERQEAARLAGGCAGDFVTLYHDGLRTASTGEIGDCDSDRPAAADDDASWLGSCRYCVRLVIDVPPATDRRGGRRAHLPRSRRRGVE